MLTKLKIVCKVRLSFDTERYPSGQRGQTVNLLVITFEGSNPSLSNLEAFFYEEGL